ncbi:MAG TPA: hypothetical protein VLB29_10365 [Nocardioidaceae bacterium]|nr:hypothetical protein [Nocardioidaceae bacterium]
MAFPSRVRGAGLVALLLLVSAGCSSADTGGGEGADAPAAHGENTFGHVHGLGVNPADDRLYVASHMGVFRQTDQGFDRVADRWQDTMAFTVAGPDHFLGSGHPDTREDKPVHLGLIETTDAAETWQELSLAGEADFHALEVAGERLYGYDSLTGALMVTEDRRTWSKLLTGPLLDVEADPADPDSLLLADQRGQLVRLETGGNPQPVEGAPLLGWLDWAEEDRLVGLGPEGTVWLSTDGAASWSQVGEVPGSPQALTTEAETWYAATERGLFASSDQGGSWKTVPQD